MSDTVCWSLEQSTLDSTTEPEREPGLVAPPSPPTHTAPCYHYPCVQELLAGLLVLLSDKDVTEDSSALGTSHVFMT